MQNQRALLQAARQCLRAVQQAQWTLAPAKELAQATASVSASVIESQNQAFPWGAFRLGIAAAGATLIASTPSSSHCAPSREAPGSKQSAPATAPIDLSKAGFAVPKSQRTVVFVLGGPGSGKGTQNWSVPALITQFTAEREGSKICAKLVEEFGLLHMSAGDLLRAHMKSGTEDGQMVADMIKEGKIVPSHVTISLLDKAMEESGKSTFLIDGFPRNEENRAAFEKQTKMEPSFILFFDCPEKEMERRLLGRNEGRSDDNIDTIRKRFQVFLESSMPVVEHYEKLGKLRRFRADRSQDEIYAEVRKLF